MIRDVNNVNLSGKIFWSKLDEHGSYSTLRLGIDIGEGSYNRVFTLISNPHEKSYQFIKNDNQVILMGAWLDSWVKEDKSSELQIKAYDSNVQFYLPGIKIPHFNEVQVYGTVKEFKDNTAIIDCVGGRNPKTNVLTHRMVTVDIGPDLGDPTGKKMMIRGSMGIESIGESKSRLKVFVDYDKINIMG